MKTIVKLIVASFLGMLTYAAQANDGVGWSVTVGTPTYYVAPIRHYAPPAVVYYDSPVVVYRQSPQVVVLPHAGYDTFYGNNVYAPQNFTRGVRFNHGMCIKVSVVNPMQVIGFITEATFTEPAAGAKS